MTDTIMLIVFTVLGMSILVCLCVTIWLVARRRNDRRIMRFTAEDFRELGTVARNSMATRDLNCLYRAVKREVTSAANKGLFSTFVEIGSFRKAYGANFASLIVDPFVARMTSEGFSVEYLPNGSMRMPKRNKEPAFEISWKDAEDQDDNEEREEQDETV